MDHPIGFYEQKEHKYVEIIRDVSPGVYNFTIMDSFADGLCCFDDESNGKYRIVVDGSLILEGGEYGESETTIFTIE